MADINNCGYWYYSGTLGGIPEEPRVFTRTEKGQALTHLEMDVNLASLLHRVVTSSASSPLAENTTDTDVFFERRKPTREEEMAGLFATFSYAPVINGTASLVQYSSSIVKVQHTTDEIRYKLSNETIPGTLDIEEDFHVTGSSYVAQDSFVAGNLTVGGDSKTTTLRVDRTADINGSLRVAKSSSFEGDVYIVGNLYVNGIMFGNLNQAAYHPTSQSHETYADPYVRQGESQSNNSGTRYYTQEEVDQLLQNLREELLNEIHGNS